MHPLEIIYSRSLIEVESKLSEKSILKDRLVLNFQMRKRYRIPDLFLLGDAASQLCMTVPEFHESHVRKHGVKLES